MPEKIIFSWSGGKDSALCLYKVLQDKRYEVCYLLTTLNGNLKRVSMHGIAEAELDAQAESIGIPMKKVYVYEASNEEYERQMHALLTAVKEEGIHTVVFGDIFLEDLRRYREEKLSTLNMKAVFPLWKRDTNELVTEFIGLGFKTLTCCVNDAYLNAAHCGQLIDAAFIESLPDLVDPCGENGEYHTFCYDGPVFKTPLQVNVNDVIYKPLDKALQHPDKNGRSPQGFWYADIQIYRPSVRDN